MDAQPNEDFFELTVSQEGSARIIRLYKIVKWIFAATIFLSLVFLTMSYLRYIFFKRYEQDSDYLLQLEGNIYPIYSIIWNILWIVQVYCYFHFTRLCKKAIELRHAELFNASFKWLLRSAVLFLVVLAIEFVVSTFQIYIQIQLLQKYPAAT